MSRSSYINWFSWAPLLPIAVIVASPWIGEAQAATSTCPGIPLLCGMTCSPDAFGTPIYCSNGQCTCAPGYETRSGPSGLVCVPTQPEVIGTEARDPDDLDDVKYACSGVCTSDSDNRVGGAVPWSPVGNACQGGSQSGTTCLGSADCVGTCGPKTTGQCQGGTRDGLICHDPSDCPGTVAQCVPMGFCSGHGGLCESDADCAGQCVPVAYKPFDLVPVHGIAPGGEAFMPVWGNQANQCGVHGLRARCSGGSNNGSSCNTPADCPGGACNPVGLCRGGSNATAVCFGSADCAGTCGPKTTGQCQGGTRDGLICHDPSDCPGTVAQCVPMGFCSGHGGLCESDADCAGQCVPVPAGQCSTDGRTCSRDADCPRGGTCNPVRTWAGCAPDPFPFCFGLQDSDEGDFDFPNCESTEGCGSCGDVDCGDWRASRSASGGQDACGQCGHCVHTFTSAWPYIDNSLTCALGATIGINGGVSDPARIDFPNNGIVYRAPTRWESFCDERFGCLIDQDFTWDMESPGRELHDTDSEFAYHKGCADETNGRVHIEFNALESVVHFVANDWGAANEWWRAFADVVGRNVFQGEQGNNNVRCFVKSFVNPGLTCPPSADVDADCSLHDPMAVVAGIPSIDCADDAYQGTDEIHPVLGMALRIQEDPTLGTCQGGSNGGDTCRADADCAGTCGPKTTGQCQGGTRDGLICHDPSDCPGTVAQCVPMGFCSGHGGLCESNADCAGQCRVGQQWTFFYRQTGNNGPCGGSSYSRCLSTFKLPLGLPELPGNSVLTGADVHVDWHAWRMDDSVPTDVNVDSSFDLTSGTVLNITLPHFDEGVVGLVTVTPTLDTTPPQLTCPAPIVVDATGPSGAVVTYAPSASDDCSATSVACTPPSGATFAVGDSTVGCTAADVANNTTSCSFTIHVKGAAEQTGDLITMVNGLATKSGIRNSLLAKLNAALARLQGGNPADACGSLHAFINEVNAQRGKSISASDADALVTAALQIMVVNGCGP